MPNSTRPSPAPTPTRMSCSWCSTGPRSRCTPTARKLPQLRHQTQDLWRDTLGCRQTGAGHLPQFAENLLQARHFVLGLPRGPTENSGRRPRALAPRSHLAERLSVVHIKPPWPLSAGETDQVPPSGSRRTRNPATLYIQGQSERTCLLDFEQAMACCSTRQWCRP